jgi:hypothetical protein
MKGRLAGTVGTNASKMVPEISVARSQKGTWLQLLSPWQCGNRPRLGALCAHVSHTTPALEEMTDWVTFASWKWTAH